MTPSPPAAKPTNTEEYLASLSAEQRATVEQLRATVRAAVPRAEETFSYRMPGFTLAGRPLVWIAAWKRHYSLYPVSAAEVAAAAATGEVYEVEKGTVRFPAEAPPSHEFVTRLVRVRAGEIDAGGDRARG